MARSAARMLKIKSTGKVRIKIKTFCANVHMQNCINSPVDLALYLIMPVEWLCSIIIA